MKSFHKLLRTTIVTLVLVGIVGMAQVSFTDDSVAVRTNFFTDTSGLFVQSPSFQIVKSLAQDAVLTLHYSLDRVRIPPLRAISGIPLPTDAITGASRPVDTTKTNADFFKNRNEFIAALGGQSWNTSAYYSSEKDYIGRLVSFGFNRDLNQKNTNVAMSVSYGWDKITPLGANKVYSKQNVMANLTLTQTLSKVSIMRFGVDVAKTSGLQSNPYRTVFVNGGYYLEQHPTERVRAAGFVKLNLYIPAADAALWTDYRVYSDDWGILSQTIGLKFYQNMSKRLLIRYRYRYYRQNSAYFYRLSYPLNSKPGYYTADYKLMGFSSHMFGFHVSYRLATKNRWFSFLDNSTLECKYERFFTSNKFGANILQVGLTFNY